jgi:type IV secretion system protein VirB6
MGFFATFWSWLNGQLTTYIGDNTARLAAVLEPAMVTVATIYVMALGYLHLTGKVAEPLEAGLKRLGLIALVLGAGLQLWLYNSVVVDTFYNAPTQLAAAVVGAGDPVTTIDTIWSAGGEVAGQLWARGGYFTANVGFYIAGLLVWVLVGMLCVYAMFLIALSSVALAVLLALGPLFIGMLLFDATRRLFSAWLAQLSNYALITVLTVMVSALLLKVVQSFATQTAALGSTITTVDAIDMVLASVLVFLVLLQIMPIAGGLAGGVSLNSFGVISRSTAWTSRTALRASMPVLGMAAPYAGPWLANMVPHASGKVRRGQNAAVNSVTSPFSEGG